jgi:hypothetical protein
LSFQEIRIWRIRRHGRDWARILAEEVCLDTEAKVGDGHLGAVHVVKDEACVDELQADNSYQARIMVHDEIERSADALSPVQGHASGFLGIRSCESRGVQELTVLTDATASSFFDFTRKLNPSTRSTIHPVDLPSHPPQAHDAFSTRKTGTTSSA